MDEDKHETIIKAIEDKAEQMRFGVIVIELKVHNGKLSGGEILSQREKLG
jgi:hypothetical protein